MGGGVVGVGVRVGEDADYDVDSSPQQQSLYGMSDGTGANSLDDVDEALGGDQYLQPGT